VPAGARSVTFRFEDDDWWELDKQVKDVRVWAANGASSRSVSPPPPSLVGGPLVHAGTAPSAGLALLTTSTDTMPQTLAASLVTDGCAWPRFAVTQQGRWHTYVAGAPAFVNLGFPSTLAAGTPFSVRC